MAAAIARAAPCPPDRKFPTVHKVIANGLRVAYRRAGEGPPLLLLHGGPGHSGEWRPQLDGLSDGLAVVAPDMPGSGGSDDPPAHWRMRDYADCLAAFWRELDLSRPRVLGLSFGSGLALELYRWYPSLPRSLVLASAYAGWAGSLGAAAAEQRRQRMLQMIELPPGAWAEHWLPTLLPAGLGQPPGGFVLWELGSTTRRTRLRLFATVTSDARPRRSPGAHPGRAAAEFPVPWERPNPAASSRGDDPRRVRCRCRRGR